MSGLHGLSAVKHASITWILWDWDVALGAVTALNLPPALGMGKNMSPVTHYTVQVYTDMQILILLNKLSWGTVEKQDIPSCFSTTLLMLWYLCVLLLLFFMPFQCMVVGQHGLHGLSARLSVILGFRLENVSVVLLHLCTGAAAAWDLIYRRETATPSPAQV